MRVSRHRVVCAAVTAAALAIPLGATATSASAAASAVRAADAAEWVPGPDGFGRSSRRDHHNDHSATSRDMGRFGVRDDVGRL